MNVTIRKIGNSEGIIIPKEILERLNLKSGDAVDFIETEGSLTIRPANDKFARQMEAARKIMDQYKVALAELAK